MTMRRWTTVMWGLEAAALAVTLTAMYLAVRGGWPLWLALVGIGAAGVVLAEALLAFWKRRSSEPIEQMRARETARRAELRADRGGRLFVAWPRR